MMRGLPSSDPTPREQKGYTLVEMMVVVVLIGLLAAAGLPGYRQITMRSKVTATVNDLRQFSTVLQTYATQNGRWPADAEPQLAPSELADNLPRTFVGRTPIGGVYKWNFGDNAMGIPAKAAICIVTVDTNKLDDDIALLELLDSQLDDGNLTEGMVQVNAGSLVYIIEK